MTSAVPAQPSRASRRAPTPRQHGAWAMLATPLLLGVAVSQPSAWQLVLAMAAVTGFLASATTQAWLRARRPPDGLRLLAALGVAFALAGIALVVAFPALLLTLVVLVPATAITLGGAKPGTPRDLANSLGQVAQASVLVPAAAWVSGAWDEAAVARMTVVAVAFLLGEVLVVRSVLRERGNRGFRALSIGYHAMLAGIAAVALPAAWTALALVLLARAAALPAVQAWRAGTTHPLRPVQVGMLELACSVALVIVAFAVPLTPA